MSGILFHRESDGKGSLGNGSIVPTVVGSMMVGGACLSKCGVGFNCMVEWELVIVGKNCRSMPSRTVVALMPC